MNWYPKRVDFPILYIFHKLDGNQYDIFVWSNGLQSEWSPPEGKSIEHTSYIVI